ncbi:MAG: PINc/VapC family ATPase [Candidatus Woesearchaeota archaeon]
MNYESVVVDTSVVAEAALLQELKRLSVERVIIPRSVVLELEHLANSGKETGFIGLDELAKLHAVSEEAGFVVSFTSETPTRHDIARASGGSMDALIRQIAFEESAALLTADRVQARTAQAQGIEVVFVDFSAQGSTLDDPLASFFTDDTMSVHIMEGASTSRKRGSPGNWSFERLEEVPSAVEVEGLAKRIIAAASQRSDSFLEIERGGSSIVQLGKYRIVITRPPFASRYEITAVRPVKQLSLDEYVFPEKFRSRIEEKAEGILVAGSPGEGKSTFTQALGAFYASLDKVVKTVEAPRDLVLPEGITQYSASHGSPEEIRDVLLLNRPDYTIYDEIRNNQDFSLYADMRMSGIGMIGVVHAAGAVDAIQRFIGRIELGVVPQVVDTVVYIKGGKIAKVLSLKMVVKTPAGMTEADLARPVIEVRDFFEDKVEYEIYTYGDQTMVIPVDAVSSQGAKKSAVLMYAEEGIREYFSQFDDRIDVELLSDKKVVVYVPKKLIAQIIGKGGERIKQIEEDLGLSVDVQELSGGKASSKGVSFKVKASKSQITVLLPAVYANKEIDLYAGNDYLLTATASKQAQVSISLKSDLGRQVKKAYEKKILTVLT